MRLLSLSGTGIKGRDFTHEHPDLQPVTVWTGANGIGKSSRLLAVELALRGPGKSERRYGSADTVTASVTLNTFDVPSLPNHTTIRREIVPKQKLAVDGWDKGTLRDLQGRLDGLLQLQPAVFDLSEFTGMTDAAKRQRLLQLAAPVPAEKYQDLCPDVVALPGESASAWMARAIEAMREERLALQAQARRSDVTTVTLTSATRGQFEAVEPLRAEIALVEARLEATRKAAALQERIDTALAAHAATEARRVELAGRELPTVEPDDGAEAAARRTLAELERKAADLQVVAAKRQAAAQRLDSLQHAPAIPHPGQPVDTAALEIKLAEAQREANRIDVIEHKRAGLRVVAERLDADLANLGRGRLPAQATMVALRAEVLAGDTVVACQLLDGLQQLLDVSGYPAGALAIKANRAHVDEELRTLGAAGPRPDVTALEAELRAARAHNNAAERASAARAARRKEVAELEAELVALGPAPMLPDLGPARAALEAAVAASATRNQAQAEAARLQRDREDAGRAVLALQTQIDALTAELAALAASPDTRDADEARLQQLRADLEGAVQRAAVRETEAKLAAEAGRQSARLVHVKKVEAALKDELDKVLRESIAPVADAMAPFCELIDGRFGLGEDSPLGFYRGTTWIPLEAASDSEQAVYGAGLALALAGTSSGLRLVMLDRLDVCDAHRQERLLQMAADLVQRERLDNLLATTHLQPQTPYDSYVSIIRL